MLIGTDGVYSYTFEHERRDDCPVCGGEALEIVIAPDFTVEQMIEMLVEKQDMCVPTALRLISLLTLPSQLII
jgi:ubiquitin-activating enzyme E1 C